MLKAFLSDTYYDVALNLSNLDSRAKFIQSYKETRDKVVKCENKYYCDVKAKRELVSKMNPLERNMLRYLLMFDPKVIKIRERANKKNIKVFIRPFLMGFGLMQLTID